jgi:hypothetical protein
VESAFCEHSSFTASWRYSVKHRATWYYDWYYTTPLPFVIVAWLNGQPDSLRLFEQMVWPRVTVSLGDDRRAGLVAYQHSDFRVRKPALARLRDKV